MACGRGEPTAEDCAIMHWCGPLKARRGRDGQWRADCPFPGCGADRSFEFDTPGKHVRWRSFCKHHDREALRPYVAAVIGPCMPGGPRREPIRHADLEALALSSLPPLALKVQMLIYSGMTATEALDKLGVDRTTRYRVRGQLSRFGDKSAGR